MKCMILRCILKCVSNKSKPAQNFDFSETELLFRFVLFEKFQWVCYSQWEDGTPCLHYVLIGYKKVRGPSLENLYKKLYQTWPTAVKTFKSSNKNTQKETNTETYIFR